jgi:hypothetical protein
MSVDDSPFRIRSLVLGAVALAALGLGIAVLVWASSYQPLAFGGGSVYPPISVRLHGDGFAQNNVKFRQGRLTGEHGSFADLPLSHRRIVVAGPSPESPLEGQWVEPSRRFRPFDLPPGQVMFVQLNATYHAHCRPAPGEESSVLGGFQVRYGVLWHKRTAEIDFPANLSINFPLNEDCLDMRLP